MKEMIAMAVFINFLKKIYFYRSMIKVLAIREIQSRYVGTLGGFTWSVLNPLLMILVFWFIFSVGFKVAPAGGVPFILIFLCGLIPWTLFSETLMANTNALLGSSHFVTKMVFPTEILSVVNMVASLITHCIMLIILLILMFLNDIPFSIYNLQFVYYLLGLAVFMIGLSWFFSALNVFYRDIGQILGVVLNLWFWMTPVVWAMDIIPEKYQYYFNFNPMVYIVAGYKYSFIYHIPFWTNFRSGIYFWVVSLSSFIIGGLTFRRLKPEFAEVL